MIYQSTREFKLWAYTVSHCSLIIRSMMKFPDEEDFTDDTSNNLDIEFWAVTFIDIPVFLKSIKIREINEQDLPNHITRELCKYNQKIFEIEEDKKYYIIAGGLLVGSNKWVNRDRIFNHDMNLIHDIVILTT